MSYAEHFQTKETPQSESADPRQVTNSAGGFTFALDKWARLERWLVLGSEGSTYYASERQLTRENAQTLVECLKEDARRAVSIIVEMSVSGRAPKNDPAIFALAVAAGSEDPQTRRLALSRLSDVCRTGTHLFQFVGAVEGFRGWGRGLRRAVAAWYAKLGPRELQVQVLKYQQRGGWSHRDLLRLCHVKTTSEEHQAALRWVICHQGDARVVKGPTGPKTLYSRERKYPSVSVPEMLADYEVLKSTRDLKEVLRLIEKHGYTHEMLPSEAKVFPEVWEAILPKMPMAAMIRNLNKMTSVGLLKPMSAAARTVSERLRDEAALKKARVHPIQLLSALKTYGQGHGERGGLTWQPVREVVDALDEGFYLSFSTIEPSGKRVLLAIDVSGSMDSGTVSGVAGLTPRLGAAAMSMVTARAEKDWHCVAFSSGAPGEFTFGAGRSQWGGFKAGLTELTISPRQRLDDVCAEMRKVPMGGTDCALPMLYAAARGLGVDAFCIYTDNETWAGSIHPHQALRAYRDKTGIAAKLAVVAMTATDFTIADPSDAGMLDFSGFDSAAPAVMADFIRR